MIAVCVLGNSHITAIKDGWSSVPDTVGGLRPTFIAAPGRVLRDVRIEHKRLIPTTLDASRMMHAFSDGVSLIDTEQYDRFLLVGLGLMMLMHHIYSTHRLTQHLENDEQIALSAGALQAAICGSVEDATASGLIRMIRSVSDRPILVLPEPFASENIVTDEEMGPHWTNSCHREMLHRLYLDALTAVMSSLGATLILQPEDTVAQKVFTRAVYSERPTSLVHGGAQRRDDYRHMNGMFGARMIETAFGH